MLKFRHILTFLLLILLHPAYAQEFQAAPANLVPFANGGMNWGDYNNDGALDLLLNGNLENGTGATSLFKNHNGEFAEVTANLPPLYGGSSMWGDCDNDGDLDLLVCGINPAGDGKTLLYRNNNGLFFLTDAYLTGLALGEAIWLDYNNDGNLDILLTGDSSYNTPVTKLYRNNGNTTFTPTPTNLFHAQQSFVTSGDYDNDGDVDILLGGASDSGYVTKLFRNDSGTFNDSGIPLLGIGYGDGIFLDYDKDGDQDIILMGSTISSEYVVMIYRNEGDGLFSVVPSPMVGEWVGHIDAADINNDGFPDLCITGSLCCGDALTNLYLNDGNGNFGLHPGLFPAIYSSNVNFGDYDNDGDADFALAGIPPDGPGTTFSSLFRNQSLAGTFTSNTPPSVPSGLTSLASDHNVSFHWEPTTDNTTPSAALTYNLRVGLSPETMEIMAPLSDPVTGFSKVFMKGNCGQVTSYTLEGLPNGTYYWSVQALDHSNAASAFAPVQSFEIGAVGTGVLQDKNQSIRTFPNPASQFLTIAADPAWENGTLFLFSTSGKLILFCLIEKAPFTIDISAYKPGLYCLIFEKGQKMLQRKICIN